MLQASRKIATLKRFQRQATELRYVCFLSVRFCGQVVAEKGDTGREESDTENGFTGKMRSLASARCFVQKRHLLVKPGFSLRS